jgi:hypothetical protein
MSSITTTCIAYTGTLDEIPDNASPGLLYLKAYLPALDSLSSSPDPLLHKIVSPSAVIINNGNPPAGAGEKGQRERKLTKRAAALKSMSRVLRRAWDVDGSDGRRTVLYESINHYIFAADETADVSMPEAGTIELERVESEKGVGVSGYWTVEARSWHNPAPIKKKREELGC